MKLHKYLITRKYIIGDNKDEIIERNLSKAASKRWLKEQVSKLNDNEKRKMLFAFYDKHINDHKWYHTILDFLLNAAINDKFLKCIDKKIRIGKFIYVINEEELTKDK